MTHESPPPDRSSARLPLILLAASGVIFTLVVLLRLRGVPPIPRVMIIVFEWLLLGLVARLLLRPRSGGDGR